MLPPIHVLALFAHPDDAEFLCAGTLAHLATSGAILHFATMTAGDCGSTILRGAKIAQVRRREAARAAQIIGGDYSCLDEKDLSILYDRRTLGKVIELVRRVGPAMVLTHSPMDYMVDHETTSRLCQTACFGAMAPNFRTGIRPAAKPLQRIPHLYYTQPFGGRDILGKEICPNLVVDITATFSHKKQMLACHESQQAWLRSQQAISAPLDAMEQEAKRIGELAGFRRAEGFRQHLGHSFPQDNPLGELLGERVRLIDC